LILILTIDDVSLSCCALKCAASDLRIALRCPHTWRQSSRFMRHFDVNLLCSRVFCSGWSRRGETPTRRVTWTAQRWPDAWGVVPDPTRPDPNPELPIVPEIGGLSRTRCTFDQFSFVWRRMIICTPVHHSLCNGPMRLTLGGSPRCDWLRWSVVHLDGQHKMLRLYRFLTKCSVYVVILMHT